MKSWLFDKSVMLYITLSGILTPFLYFIEKYIFADWPFAIFLFVMMIMDTVVGIWKHWKKGDINADGFAAFFQKFIIYSLTLILVHNLTNYTANGKENVLFMWLDDMMYALLMSREALSILESMVEINSQLLPKWVKDVLIKKLKHFDESGNIEAPKKKDDE